MIKKLFCALALMLCVGVSANAQDETKKNQFVIYAGPQLSTASCGGVTGKFSYLAGVQYERNGVFGDAFGLFGGLEYTAKGTKDFTFVDGSQANYDLNYLQLNLGVKYAKEIWGIDGFAEVGPYLAYGIGGSSNLNGYELDGNSFDDLSVRGGYIFTDGGAGFSNMDFGYNIAVGAQFGGFRIMAGYQQGLTNIADENLISSPGYKNYGFYAKVGYAF